MGIKWDPFGPYTFLAWAYLGGLWNEYFTVKELKTVVKCDQIQCNPQTPSPELFLATPLVFI